jgi:hypothetical protein
MSEYIRTIIAQTIMKLIGTKNRVPSGRVAISAIVPSGCTIDFAEVGFT